MQRRIAAALAALLLLACAGCHGEGAAVSSPPVSPSPVSAPLVQPSPTGTGGVRTDWSKLTPYQPEENICTRRYGDFTATLRPAGDYGPLLPFLGDALGGNTYDGARYGLVTLDGEVVADPVFSHVWRGDNSAGLHNAAPLPYMMLELGASADSPEEWPQGGNWAMAAPDGSWCTEFKYDMDGELVIWGWDINTNATERGLFVLDGGALVYLDGATGRELLRVEDIPQDKLYDALFSARWDGAGAVYCWYDYAARGTEDYRRFYRTDPLGTVRLTGQEAELADLRYWDGRAVRDLDPEGAEVVDRAGHVLLRTGDRLIYRPCGEAGQYLEYRVFEDEQAYRLDILAVYDGATLERVEDSPLPGRRVQLMDNAGWCWCREGKDLLFFLGDEVERLTWPVDPGDLMWDRVVCFPGENGSTLVTLDGEVLAKDLKAGDYVRGFDRVTGEPYLLIREGRALRFYDEDGRLFLSCDAAPSDEIELADGALLVTGADCSGLREPDGAWRFRWMLPAGEWD